MAPFSVSRGNVLPEVPLQSKAETRAAAVARTRTLLRPEVATAYEVEKETRAAVQPHGMSPHVNKDGRLSGDMSAASEVKFDVPPEQVTLFLHWKSSNNAALNGIKMPEQVKRFRESKVTDTSELLSEKG